MSRNPTPAPDREPAFEVPDAAPVASADTPPPAPVTAAPVTAAPVTAGATVVDGPSLVPDRSSMPGDPARGEGVSGSLSPEVAPVADLADPFGLDLDVGSTGSSQFGAGALELPDGPEVVDLPRTGELDVGVDWNDLGGGTGGTLDGRGIDNFEGGSSATGRADPSGMIGDGASGLTTESNKATVGEWIGSFFGMSSDADEAFDKADEAAAKAEGGTNASGLTTPGVNVTDDGVKSKVKEPTGEAATFLKGWLKSFTGEGDSERQKQMDQIGPDKDGLPPDHPDYVGAPSERPPGSATDDSIEQSVRQGLGGDRGGDVDPYDDPNATPTDGEAIFDPYDSVVNPGPDGFLPSGQVDESHLPDAMDMVDPYLADG